VVALGKEPSTNASLVTAVSLCRVLTWLSAKPLPRACHVAIGKDCLCRLRLCRAVFAERALGKGFAESVVALCRALGLSAKYQNPVVLGELHHFGSARGRCGHNYEKPRAARSPTSCLMMIKDKDWSSFCASCSGQC